MNHVLLTNIPSPAWAGTVSTQWMFTNHRDSVSCVRPVTPGHEPSWHRTQTSGSSSPWGRPSPSPRSRVCSLCSPGPPPWPADTSWVTSSVISLELDIRTRLEMKALELTARNRWWPHQRPRLAKDNSDLMRTLRGVGWSETPDKECKIRDKST